MTASSKYWRYCLRSPYELRREPLQIAADAVSGTEIFVSTVMSAISPGTELAAFNGEPPLRASVAPYPRLLGYMNVGLIEATGSAVSEQLQPGDLIYTHTAHQNAAIVTEDSVLAKLSPSCSKEKAAPAYLYRLGLNALRRGQFSENKVVAVVGLGAIGLATVNLCSSMNASCYAVSNYELALSTAEKLGGIGLERSAAEDQYQQDTARFGGLADISIVTTNSWRDLRLAAALTKFNGTISVLGFPGRGEPVWKQNPLDSRFFYDRQQSVIAAGFGPEKLGDGVEDGRILKDDLKKILDQISLGNLKSELLVGRTMPAQELKQALVVLSGTREFCGTISLNWQYSSCS